MRPSSPSSGGRTSASRPCSTGSSAGSSRSSTTARASPATGARARRGSGPRASASSTRPAWRRRTRASLLGRMRAQTEAAIADADVVLFVIDARAGLLPADRPFAELVRRSGKPVILVANKAEGGAGHGRRLRGVRPRARRPGAALGRARRGLGRPRRGAAAVRSPRTRRTRTGERDEDPPAQGRHRRPAERRQVDAHQPPARRGSPARRPRGRHHPRRHLPRLGPGAGGRSSCSTPPGCAAGPGSTTSWRSSRSPTACAPCASPRWWWCSSTPRSRSRSRT